MSSVLIIMDDNNTLIVMNIDKWILTINNYIIIRMIYTPL